MDWTAVRLFSLGIGGAFVMGSVIATAYYVGGAEPILLDASDDAPSTEARSQGAADPTGAVPRAGDGPSPPDPPAAPPSPEAGALKRTPAVRVPTASEGGGETDSTRTAPRGGSGGGERSDGADDDQHQDPQETNEGDALPFLQDPKAHVGGTPADGAVDDAAQQTPSPPGAPSTPSPTPPSAPVTPPAASLPDEDDVTEPVLDVKANVPSVEKLLPGLRFPAMVGLADALLRGV